MNALVFTVPFENLVHSEKQKRNNFRKVYNSDIEKKEKKLFNKKTHVRQLPHNKLQLHH